MSEVKGESKPTSRCVSHYDILGISETVTEDQIAVAYRDAIKKSNFDIDRAAMSDEERRRVDETAQNINVARDALSNPEKRKEYDVQLKMVREREEEQERLRRQRLEQEQREQEEKLGRERRESANRASREKQRQQAVELDRKKRGEEIKKALEKKRHQEEIYRKGKQLGERLSHWVNTEEGRSQLEKDEGLLTWAEREALVIEKFLHSGDYFRERARTTRSSVGSNGSLYTSGTTAQEVEKKLYKHFLKESHGREEAAKNNLRRFEQRLREQESASRYSLHYGDPMENSGVPDVVRHLTHSDRISQEFRLEGEDRTSHINGFKNGWEEVIKNPKAFTRSSEDTLFGEGMNSV